MWKRGGIILFFEQFLPAAFEVPNKGYYLCSHRQLQIFPGLVVQLAFFAAPVSCINVLQSQGVPFNSPSIAYEERAWAPLNAVYIALGSAAFVTPAAYEMYVFGNICGFVFVGFEIRPLAL
jgi:hypothetical protein